MFSWSNIDNYYLIITKYTPNLVFCVGIVVSNTSVVVATPAFFVLTTSSNQHQKPILTYPKKLDLSKSFNTNANHTITAMTVHGFSSLSISYHTFLAPMNYLPYFCDWFARVCLFRNILFIVCTVSVSKDSNIVSVNCIFTANSSSS